MLLDACKVDVDSRDNYGRTPLSWAVAEGHEVTTKLLLDTCKVDVDSKDNNGRTPLSWAAQGGHTNSATSLLERTAIHTPVGVTRTQENGEVVGQISVQSTPHCDADGLGRTASMWAALGGNLSLIQSLWPSHLPPSRPTNTWKDSLGLSFLHLFAIGNCAQGINLVLDAGCDINETESQGWTPLHWAAYFDHKVVLNLLLDRGADKDLKDSRGWTPYQISRFFGAGQLDELLETPPPEYGEVVLKVAQPFNAHCDSCQRVSRPQLSRKLSFTSGADLVEDNVRVSPPL
jgi:ankyrin repeat protein